MYDFNNLNKSYKQSTHLVHLSSYLLDIPQLISVLSYHVLSILPISQLIQHLHQSSHANLVVQDNFFLIPKTLVTLIIVIYLFRLYHRNEIHLLFYLLLQVSFDLSKSIKLNFFILYSPSYFTTHSIS